ncbi:MAG: hypothetical protein EOP48_17255 [Sphingobacteriales bacterium]|nr:MAG: hypothetical protein EOP48_17255 [Sphingobacteriales bacterium]
MSIAVANWREDARSEIYGLVDQINNKGFNVDKDYILKAILFLFHKDVRFQITSFKTDFVKQIEENWDSIRNAIHSLFDTIRTFGLNSYTLTTNNATLPILYYIYHKGIYQQFADKVAYEQDRKVIRHWLFNILVRKTFGGQGDNVLTQARRAFLGKELNAGEIMQLGMFPAAAMNTEIRKITDISDDYIEELLLTQKGSQYSFPLLALLYPHLDYKNNNFHQDHLHPAASYSLLSDEDKQKYGWQVYNSILNLQMLDANLNSSKNDGPLEPWIADETGDKNRDMFLATQIIPSDAGLKLIEFADFIEKRRTLLKNKLRALLNQ